MAFAILFCLLLDHQVVAGVMEQRLLRSEVSTTRVGPSESSSNKTPETKDSTRTFPTNNSNKLVVDQSTSTDTRGRIILTEVVETIGTSISRQLAASKQTRRELKESRLLKKTIRRNLIRSALERKIASKISPMSTRIEASTADSTKRISLMKIETEAVYPRKVNLRKHKRLNRKLSSESRRVLSGIDYVYVGNEVISAYLKSASRRNLDVDVAQHEGSISAESMEPKRLVEEANVFNSQQMVSDFRATRKGEAWDYQVLDLEFKSLSVTPSDFMDENVDVKKDETDFFHGFRNEESNQTNVQTDEMSKRVKREENNTTPGTDSTSAGRRGAVAMGLAGARNVTAVLPFSAIGEKSTTTEKGFEEMPSEVDESDLFKDLHPDTIYTTTARSKLSAGAVYGIVGGLALGGVLLTIIVFVCIRGRRKKKKAEKAEKAEKGEKGEKGEKEPLKSGGTKLAAMGIATNDSKGAATPANLQQMFPLNRPHNN